MRFDIYLVNLDPDISGDAKVARPAVVISPDEMNQHLQHVIVAPVSASSREYPTRISVELLNERRYIILDQMRAIDKARLVKKIGEIDAETRTAVASCLEEFFSA